MRSAIQTAFPCLTNVSAIRLIKMIHVRFTVIILPFDKGLRSGKPTFLIKSR